jgi:basic amino acid/polyamine antiporter, APA family
LQATQHPRQGFGPFQVFAFGFGSIVGIAWVVLMGQMLALAGLMGAFLGLTVGAAMMILIGSCYAEIGSILPLAGGEVAYTREIFGLETSHLLGWYLLLSCILVCGFEMVSVGWLISQLWPESAHTRLYTIQGSDVYLEPLLTSIVIQTLIAVVNYRGTHASGRLQGWTTGLKLTLSLGFIVAAFWSAHPAYARPLFVGDVHGAVIPGILSVVAVAPFWFSGFNSISQTLGERSSTMPAQQAARLITVSLVAAWIFYGLVLLAMTLTMPRAELLSQPLATSAAFQAAFHSASVGRIVLFAALLGLISTWNALFFGATRILWVLSEGGFTAAVFRRLHPQFRTPMLATWTVALVIPVCAFFGKSVLEPLLSLFSVVMAAIYAVVCVGVIILRRRHVGLASRGAWRTSLPYLALAVCVTIAALSLAEPLKAWKGGGVPFEWLVLVAWSCVGGWLLKKHRTA